MLPTREYIGKTLAVKCDLYVFACIDNRMVKNGRKSGFYLAKRQVLDAGEMDCAKTRYMMTRWLCRVNLPIQEELAKKLVQTFTESHDSKGHQHNNKPCQDNQFTREFLQVGAT